MRRSRWLVWPVAALVTLGVVGQASYAAFSTKVSNTGNTLAAGTVTLSDDDSGSALLALSNLKPGSSGSRCIAVTSTGTLPSAVKLYATDVATTKSLSSYITWTVTQGSGGTYSSCSGFSAASSGASVYSGTLAGFTTSATTYASGLGSWTPGGVGSETRTFQFGYAVSSTIPDTAQGGTASFGLTWEAQNS
ncbi:TasA family protein [Microlunatus flavus]|uniref:TasA family protein n=1 Tax=Microlunatus flavus TaxID=1036181 RepID=UPI0018E093C6|nr:TasA family protein [Microlunatus flavus]